MGSPFHQEWRGLPTEAWLAPELAGSWRLALAAKALVDQVAKWKAKKGAVSNSKLQPSPCDGAPDDTASATVPTANPNPQSREATAGYNSGERRDIIGSCAGPSFCVPQNR